MLLLFLILLSLAAWADEPSFLQTYAQTRGFLLGRPQKPKFTPDAGAVLFLRSEPKKRVQSLFEYDLKTKETREIASPQAILGGKDEKLTPEEKARRERQRIQTSGFADFWLDGTGRRVLLPLAGKLYLLERATGKVTPLKVGGAVTDPQWSPDFRSVAYVRNHDLYVLDVKTNREKALTKGGSDSVTHGEAEFVAQEEMRRHHGFWWSPDSRWLAYEEADMRGVETWYLADPFKPGSAPGPQRYPRPGEANAKVRLGVIPAAGGPTTWVRWGQPYEYLAAVRWDKKGPLTIQLQDRKQQLLSLLKVDPATGKLTKLLDQRDPRWVNLRQDGPVWVDKTRFLMPLEQDGWEDIVLVGPGGERKTVVPPGGRKGEKYEVSELLGYTDGTIHCRIEETPGSGRLLNVGLEGTPTITEQGVTEAAWTKGKAVITTHTLDHLPVTSVDGQALPSVALEPDTRLNLETVPLNDQGWTAIVVKPANFQENSRYPVILDVYGGPRHLHAVPARRNWLVAQWLANQGFVVVAVDNRGTPGRGLEWEKAVYGKFGSVPLEDQVKGLQELGRRLPFLDLNRVGIVGWSFGGYLSAQAVLARPDIFKAAVAGAPVTDWHDYDTHYTERYMGVPPAAEDDYDAASLLPLAPQLSRPLLLVHGTADDNVYYRHSLRLADALLRADKSFELLPLPGITHSYTSDALITERLWKNVAAFFQRHLKASETPPQKS